MNIILVDYGAGNIGSVENAFRHIGACVKLGSSSRDVLTADAIILPGVGSFRNASENLKLTGLRESILEAVKTRGIPILGICLGFQLLAQNGAEGGGAEGLGLMDGEVKRFSDDLNVKVPHVGYNSVTINSACPLFRGFTSNPDFYFVHSFFVSARSTLPSARTSTCDYGHEFRAAYSRDNVFGTQFHPEKSQIAGLKVLKNFINAVS